MIGGTTVPCRQVQLARVQPLKMTRTDSKHPPVPARAGVRSTCNDTQRGLSANHPSVVCSPAAVPRPADRGLGARGLWSQ